MTPPGRGTWPGHPYDETHVRAVLDRVKAVMAEDWPRRARLGELAFKVKPGEWVDLVQYLTRERPSQP
ncbi:hypothetical protein ABT299_11635 [Spirillospora sp. NPDC000708]